MRGGHQNGTTFYGTKATGNITVTPSSVLINFLPVPYLNDCWCLAIPYYGVAVCKSSVELTLSIEKEIWWSHFEFSTLSIKVSFDSGFFPLFSYLFGVCKTSPPFCRSSNPRRTLEVSEVTSFWSRSWRRLNFISEGLQPSETIS